MSKELLQETNEALVELRKSVEVHGINSPEYKEMVEKTDKAFAASDARHEAIVKELSDEKQARLDTEERVKDFEKTLAHQSHGGVKNDFREGDHYKVLNFFMRHGEKALSVEQGQLLDANAKTMRMDSDVAGGYLTDTEMDTAIIKKITEISPVRQLARVRTVSKKTLEMPVRNTIPTAAYEGEAEENSEGAATYQNEQLTTYRLSTTVPFTLDLLGDSNFDLMSEINADVAEAFAYTEGNKFVVGTGSKQPEGFLANASVVAGASETAGSGVLAGDDLLTLTGELKTGYNPMFGFNRKTLASIRVLKGTANDHYIFQVGLAPGVPNTIGGDPYAIIPDMPDIAAGALSVVYADFMRGYTITDRTGMLMIRDEVTEARKAIVKATFHRWNTGQVTLPEAFKALKIKA